MAYTGQVIENPVSGERITFKQTAADTDGELLAIQLELSPDGAVPGLHVHPSQEERFEIVSGRMKFRKGMKTIYAEAGDVVTVEPGVAHSFANAGDGEARLRVQVHPALAMEEMFADVVELAEAGRMTRRGMPRSPLDLALLARTYDEEAHAPVIGRRLQRILLAPVVALARLRTSPGAAVEAALAAA
jgi:quercetin dioxygenase-like cupin family protein